MTTVLAVVVTIAAGRLGYDLGRRPRHHRELAIMARAYTRGAADVASAFAEDAQDEIVITAEHRAQQLRAAQEGRQ